MSEPVTIILVTDREQELHVMGPHVSVVFNLRMQSSMQNVEGRHVLTFTRERIDDPYIDFAWIREDKDGTFYRDDDDSVQGGLSSEAAKQVAKELLKAVAYIESGAWNNLSASS